jgi:hypothetical protein
MVLDGAGLVGGQSWSKPGLNCKVHFPEEPPLDENGRPLELEPPKGSAIGVKPFTALLVVRTRGIRDLLPLKSL